VLEAVISNAGDGRPLNAPARTLRTYLLVHRATWPMRAMREEAIFESELTRWFMDIDLGRDSASDETTACAFRHLLKRSQLVAKLLEGIGRQLQVRGLTANFWVMVDAATMRANRSTKNQYKNPTPEMRQRRNGRQGSWG